MRKKTLYKYTGILWGYFRNFMSKVFIKNLIGRVDDLIVSSKTVVKPVKGVTPPVIPIKDSLPIDSLEIASVSKPLKRTLPDGKIEHFSYRPNGTLKKSQVEDWVGCPCKITRYDEAGKFLCHEVDSVQASLGDVFKFDEATIRSIERISKSKNVDLFTAGVMARSKRIKFVSEKQADEIIKSIQEKCSSKNFKSSRFSGIDYGYTLEEYDACIIAKFIDENPQIKLSDFKNYIDNISLDELYKIAPRLKKYNSEEMLEFLKHHYISGTTRFDESILRFPKDITKYLEEAPLDAYQIQKLLAKYPNTNRNFGNLPKKWNILTQEQSDQVRMIFDKFREEIAYTSHRKTLISGNPLSTMQKELSNILGREVRVVELETGKFAKGYKISVDGPEDVVMKVFHKKPETLYESFNIHGQFVEPQRGIFLSANSEQFAKTYFGKITTEIDRDGYIVTEFLEDTGKKASSKECFELKDYFVFCDDIAEGHNTLDGKIIDFGDIHIIPRK